MLPLSLLRAAMGHPMVRQRTVDCLRLGALVVRPPSVPHP